MIASHVKNVGSLWFNKNVKIFEMKILILDLSQANIDMKKIWLWSINYTLFWMQSKQIFFTK